MEQNFDRLQKLLALKRYEQPPPGYFQSFSAKIVARIEAADSAAMLPWWQKLGLDFDFKPALLCGLGVVVCGLLSAGVITSIFEDSERSGVGLAMGPAINSPTVTPFNRWAGDDEFSSSIQPVFSASRFDQFGAPVAPNSFQFGGK